MKRFIEIAILICSLGGIADVDANCIATNALSRALEEEKGLEELITRAPAMALSQTNDVRVYRERVCQKISEVPDARMRCRYFRKLMESACTANLGRINDMLRVDQNQESWARERQMANLRLGVYYRLEGFAEEIWLNLFILERTPPQGCELFEPWFMLIEKFKAEEKRLRKGTLKVLEANVDRVERLYLFTYLSDPRIAQDLQDRAAVEARFKQVVGRPIRSAEQYMADSRRRVMKNIQEQKEREEAKRKWQEQ